MRSKSLLGVVLLLVAGTPLAEARAEASDQARFAARSEAESRAAAHASEGRFVPAAEAVEGYLKAFPHPSNHGSYGSPEELAKDLRARAALAEKAKANGRAELRALLYAAAFPSASGSRDTSAGAGYLLELLRRLRAADPAFEALFSRKVKVVAGDMEGLAPMERSLILDGVTNALRQLGIAADTGAGDDLFTISAGTSGPVEAELVGSGLLSCSMRATGRWTSGETLVLAAVDLTATKPGFSADLARQAAAAAVGKRAGDKLLKALLAAPPPVR